MAKKKTPSPHKAIKKKKKSTPKKSTRSAAVKKTKKTAKTKTTRATQVTAKATTKAKKTSAKAASKASAPQPVKRKKTKVAKKIKKTAARKNASAKKTAANRPAATADRPPKRQPPKRTTGQRAGSSKSTARATQPQVLNASSVPPPEPLSEDDLRKIKSGLHKRDLARYRQMLLDKRSEIIGDVQAMETDVRNKNADGNLSHVPLHMADVGSDNFEQEFTLGLMESERQTLREIDQALIRIEKGIYGVCLESGTPIGKPRLTAKPWAKYCIEVARQRERNLNRF